MKTPEEINDTLLVSAWDLINQDLNNAELALAIAHAIRTERHTHAPLPHIDDLLLANLQVNAHDRILVYNWIKEHLK